MGSYLDWFKNKLLIIFEVFMEEGIRAAWQGRISGCLLGKPLEMLSMREGFDSLQKYLQDANSLPLRDYVNYI